MKTTDDDQDLAAPAAVRRRPESATFAVRLLKNLRHLRRWLRNHAITCFRLYDRDVPEFPYAIDVFGGDSILYEYETGLHAESSIVDARLLDAVDAVQETLRIDASHVHWKTRRRKEGLRQYEKLASRASTLEVEEGGHRFEINLSDYLDPGLFLDHRATRAMVQELAAGRRFLNLFCYTASATVYAAKGGATSTTSVDLSKTYLEWARRNFTLNGMRGPEHRLVRADCLEWLRQERGTYDLVFVDPPTFSNSKRMQGLFDVQKDHVELLGLIARRLSPNGVILFSTNFRRFKMNAGALPELSWRDVTRATLSKDFERNPRIHQCWKATLRALEP